MSQAQALSKDFDFTKNAVTGNITVKAVNDCGETAVASQKITVSNVGSVGPISGAITLCAGEKEVSYSVPTVENALSYEWTLPTGASGTSITNSIKIDFSIFAVSGEITVKAINPCGSSSISKLAVTMIEKPATPVITRTDNTLKSSTAEGNQWYNSTGAINTAIYQEYIANANEEYFVIVTKNGCSSEPSNRIRVDNTALETVLVSKSVKIYPIPVKNELRLEFDGETRFEITNLVGQVIYNGNLIKSAIVQTSDMLPGIYLIRFTQGKAVTTQKFVKE